VIRFVKFLLGAVVALMLGLAVLNYYKDYKNDYNLELTRTDTVAGEDVEVVIPEDSSVKEIARILHKAGLIKYEKAFVTRLQSSEYRGRLQSGTYTLNTGMNTLQMMEAMASEIPAEVEVLQTLTIPEGFTIDQIATRCENQDICTYTQFINAVKSVTSSDFEYLSDVPSGADVKYKLEGYLFPATYNIYSDTTASDLVSQMLAAFEANYTSDMASQAALMGMSSYDVLRVASMIEREARIADERSMIAAVIYNRVNAKMLLQIDSTVLYAVTDGLYDVAEITTEDYSTDSLYNTYVYSGLPVGPICNPGTACINAALSPSTDAYLYYWIADEETGAHTFSETNESGEEIEVVYGEDLNGDGVPDGVPGAAYSDNHAESDVWSNTD